MKYLRYVEPLEDLFPTYEPTELRLIQTPNPPPDYIIYMIAIPITMFVFAVYCCYRCCKDD